MQIQGHLSYVSDVEGLRFGRKATGECPISERSKTTDRRDGEWDATPGC